ncbi:hypothetical protein WB66_07555 [bacteria symbiont BFo1 of Frankliniella occidentalis]|jgi:uncharacterized protein|uniref:DUF418 domain-containing protein YeiB n=1 Tax=Erwinia aphidicola TaxID=68334 RepID=UPI00066466EF|nr:DUF418 domain-containing protein YeiB [Erwinia aphidicola]KMV71339.1 hypothetical protein AI28_10825 [bacteria symbiont BFo1 of Frankliniella occidentalis]PIJ56040.1 hypothetical protein BOM23_17600 [Erwinia sp. OLMDLW33]KYP85282.1 hypothetical protein WB66_07555 [bacteria symbiont BFo1 of Frankliniella occidentalis]KYP90701.1 hypothetical protein WB91_07875 [bacteria symbiont BFo1 of Frankliniella occidentalis]MBD1375597.1 DUF418 family protein [Erwinia aphidicola]
MPRIVPLDFVRGMAILGILLLNITAFGLPKAAYLNPAWQGLPSASDFWVWASMDLLAQAKFLTLFAILFGAGLQLLLPRGKRWIQSRLSWLVIFGLLHALLLWEGDILLAYGLVGLIAWRMIRDVPGTRQLFNTGVMLYLIGSAVLVVLGLASGPTPNSSWLPGAAEVQYETFWRTQGGGEAAFNRLDMLGSALMALAAQYGWQLAGLMMLGAALMRSGWLQGTYSLQHYRRSGLILITAGLAIELPSIVMQWVTQWDFRWSGFFLQVPREISAPLQALGYAALCFGFWPQLQRFRITHGITAVGRMALSNYLLQTLICTTLFNHFALFNQLDRLQLLMLVPAIWLINLLFSTLWLRVFRQGPMEWLWRRLTRSGTKIEDKSLDGR